MPDKLGVMIRSDAGPGIPHQLTGVIAKRRANISSVEIHESGGDARTYFEIESGDRISVDTIPLVGEQPIADAVRAVARLPRAAALVLAGALMGGDIERAVREVRATGLLVVSLNMAGSVPDAADLVVTDPVQAGVMTVMAVADTAKFSMNQLKRRIF